MDYSESIEEMLDQGSEVKHCILDWLGSTVDSQVRLGYSGCIVVKPVNS